MAPQCKRSWYRLSARPGDLTYWLGETFPCLSCIDVVPSSRREVWAELMREGTPSREAIGRLWDRYDADNNGELSVSETMPMVREMLLVSRDRLLEQRNEVEAEAEARRAEMGDGEMADEIGSMMSAAINDAIAGLEAQLDLVDEDLARKLNERLEPNAQGVVHREAFVENANRVLFTDLSGDFTDVDPECRQM